MVVSGWGVLDDAAVPAIGNPHRAVGGDRDALREGQVLVRPGTGVTLQPELCVEAAIWVEHSNEAVVGPHDVNPAAWPDRDPGDVGERSIFGLRAAVILQVGAVGRELVDGVAVRIARTRYPQVARGVNGDGIRCRDRNLRQVAAPSGELLDPVVVLIGYPDVAIRVEGQALRLVEPLL